MRIRKLFADGAHVLVVRMLTVASGAAVSIIVSRALGPAGRGTYAIPGISAALAATLFAGLSTTIAASMLNDRTGRGALRAGFIAAVPLVAVAMAGVVGVAALMHQLWAAPFAVAVLPFMAISAIVNGFGYGVKNVRGVALYALSISISILLFLSAAFLLGNRTSTSAIVVWLAANGFAAIAGMAIVIRSARSLPGESVATWPFVKYALRVGATGLVSMLNYRVDVYIVAFYLSHAALGLYTTAVSAAETLFVAAQVGSIVTAPHIGSFSTEEAARFTARCVRNNLAVITLLSGFAAIVAPWVVVLLFGEAFAPAVTPLRVLLIGIVPMSMAGIIASYYTLKTRQPHIPLAITGSSAVLCAIISAFLVPRFGIVGAATGTAVSYAASIVFMIAYFSHQTKISVSRIVLPQLEDLRGYRMLLAALLRRPAAG